MLLSCAGWSFVPLRRYLRSKNIPATISPASTINPMTIPAIEPPDKPDRFESLEVISILVGGTLLSGINVLL